MLVLSILNIITSWLYHGKAGDPSYAAPQNSLTCTSSVFRVHIYDHAAKKLAESGLSAQNGPTKNDLDFMGI